MQDFLTFKTFISLDILISMYILGVFVIPIMAWWVAMKVQKYIPIKSINIKDSIFFKMNLRDKIIVVGIVLFILICMEICWRMMFEFLIAYMQIRDVLVGV